MKSIILKLINLKKKFYFKISFYFIYVINIENNFNKFVFKKNYENKIFFRLSEITEYKKKGYNFNSWDLSYFENMLNNECIVFCCFIEKNLGHTTWLSTSSKSKEMIEKLPININWKKEAIWGNAFTLEKYRNLGLHKLSTNNCIEYLRTNNYKRCYFSVRKNNKASIKSYDFFKPNKIGEGFFFQSFVFNFGKINIYNGK